MSEYPEPTVGAFIFNEKGEIFLMKSHKWKGKFVCPGGHVEIGETFEEALRREVKEETNLDVDDIKLISVDNCIFSNDFYKKKHFVFLDHMCKAKTGNVVLNEEGQEYVWIKPEEALEKLDIDPFTVKVIKKILEMKND